MSCIILYPEMFFPAVQLVLFSRYRGDDSLNCLKSNGTSVGMSGVHIIETSLSAAHVSIIKSFTQYYALITFGINRFTASLDSLKGSAALTGTGGFNSLSGGAIRPSPFVQFPFLPFLFLPHPELLSCQFFALPPFTVSFGHFGVIGFQICCYSIFVLFY